jgi:hypothetical protein
LSYFIGKLSQLATVRFERLNKFVVLLFDFDTGLLVIITRILKNNLQNVIFSRFF